MILHLSPSLPSRDGASFRPVAIPEHRLGDRTARLPCLRTRCIPHEGSKQPGFILPARRRS